MKSVLRRREVLLGGLALGGCASFPDDIIGVVGAPNAAGAGARSSHDIFVVTTRALDANPAVLFSGRRSDRLSFASATVTIPPTHRPGGSNGRTGYLPIPAGG